MVLLDKYIQTLTENRMKPLNEWETEKDDNDEISVYHYIGGEEQVLFDDWYTDQQEADARVEELNAGNIAISYEVSEGDVETIITDPSNLLDL